MPPEGDALSLLGLLQQKGTVPGVMTLGLDARLNGRGCSSVFPEGQVEEKRNATASTGSGVEHRRERAVPGSTWHLAQATPRVNAHPPGGGAHRSRRSTSVRASQSPTLSQSWNLQFVYSCYLIKHGDDYMM